MLSTVNMREVHAHFRLISIGSTCCGFVVLALQQIYNKLYNTSKDYNEASTSGQGQGIEDLSLWVIWLLLTIVVCLFVCVSARITRKPYNRSSPIFLHVACGRGFSGFVNDVMFSYHGASGPESSTTLYFKGVRQVAVLDRRQTTTVFGRVHQNAAPGGAKFAIYETSLCWQT